MADTKSSIMVVKTETDSSAMETEDSVQHVREQSDSDDEDHEPGMRIGSEYQAVIPEWNPSAVVGNTYQNGKTPEDRERKHNALLVWAPNEEIAEMKMDSYLQVAKDKHGYNVEQALGMLFWHKHNVDRSLADLPNFTPYPEEWSMEDKVLFEQAFQSHGKSFKRIQQILPDKSVGSLVKYYYSWKKTRSRTSLIDRQARRLAHTKEPEESDNSDTSDSDFEPDKEGKTNGQNKNKQQQQQQQQQQSAKQPAPAVASCMSCGSQNVQLHSTVKGQLCTSCFHYARRSGMRSRGRGDQNMRGPKIKRRPPKGMFLSQENLLTVSNSHGETYLRPLESEVVNLKRQIQTNKQSIGQMKVGVNEGIENIRPSALSQKYNARWTDEELLLAVQCVRKYGKDFQAMADVLGTKTVSQCRNFFVNHRRRFNLQHVFEEYEAEQGITSSDKKDSLDDLEVTHVSGPTYMSASNTLYPPPTSPHQSVSPPVASQGIAGQPPPLLRPTASSPGLRGPPPLQSQAISRSVHGGTPPQGPPPLIKPTSVPRPSMQPPMGQ